MCFFEQFKLCSFLANTFGDTKCARTRTLSSKTRSTFFPWNWPEAVICAKKSRYTEVASNCRCPHWSSPTTVAQVLVLYLAWRLSLVLWLYLKDSTLSTWKKETAKEGYLEHSIQMPHFCSILTYITEGCLQVIVNILNTLLFLFPNTNITGKSLSSFFNWSSLIRT